MNTVSVFKIDNNNNNNTEIQQQNSTNDNDNNNNDNVGPKLAPYNPTSTEAIYTALELLELKDNDILYDLGCGDGRLLIEVILFLYLFIIVNIS